MTKRDFLQYLSHPEKLNGHSIAALEKLVQEYPYFQIGRMLYLKNLHNENNIDYGKNVHITAAYAPNGKVLYNLIKKKIYKNDSLVAPLVSTTAEVENPKPIVTNASHVITDPLPIVSDQVITKEEIIPKLESIAVLQGVVISEKENLPVNDENKSDTSNEMQVFEKQMIREVYRTSMTVDFLEEKEVDEGMRNAADEDLEHYQNLSAISESHSFSNWLKVINEKTRTLAKPNYTESKELSIVKKSKNEILNDFLLEETFKPAPRPKAKFYSAEAMAKKSLQDDENFVSETLARIYLQQGNLPKAKRAYEILLVKYPEKVYIFAPLLEKIKKLSEEQKTR